MSLDALIINSYAGSLVIGVKESGIPIRGSFEDCGYGIESQKLNFPKLNYVDAHPWPKQDLTNTIVLAHPPCAAFSNQNNNVERRGENTDAFKCHKDVMDYSMGNHCAALAIESVPGCLKAAATYAKYAQKYKYTHYFIYLNAATFGVPQWRPRIWVMFFRDLARLVVNHRPTYKTVGDIIQPPDEVVPNKKMLHLVEYFGKKFASKGFDYEGWRKYENVGAFVNTVSEFSNVEKTRAAVDAITGVKGLFGVNLPRKLDLNWFSPVILGGCFFFAHDRPLTQIEYQRIIGFPDSWKWPDKMQNNFLTYLSKGVSPPIAKWIAEQMVKNVEHKIDLSNAKIGAVGEIIDIRPSRQAAIEGVRLSKQIKLPLDYQSKGRERFALTRKARTFDARRNAGVSA
jgi:site-specific DNA-cytosine methylase